MDILDNVIPFIGGEEDKMEREPLKILGMIDNGKVKFADVKISAQCNRVSVIDGHTECVQIKLKKKTLKDDIIKTWNNFTGEPQRLNLPSAPENRLFIWKEKNIRSHACTEIWETECRFQLEDYGNVHCSIINL